MPDQQIILYNTIEIYLNILKFNIVYFMLVILIFLMILNYYWIHCLMFVRRLDKMIK